MAGDSAAVSAYDSIKNPGGGFSSLISVVEAEPPTVSGLNDTIGTAEPVLGFGTGPGDDPTAEVNGFLKPPPTTPIASVEDDGDIFKANPTGLAGGDAVIASAEIGDGPFGSSGSGSGDFDFYVITDVAAGQTITVDVDTPFPFGDLDPFVVIWDSSGFVVGTTTTMAPRLTVSCASWHRTTMISTFP